MLRNFSYSELDKILNFKLAQLNICSQHAEMVVKGLLETSLRGIDTHGLKLFPLYLKELSLGRSNPQPEIEWVEKNQSTCLMDADNANGVISACIAMDRAQSIASKHGIGMIVVKNTNHIAAASIYTLRAAHHGYIGMCMTNSDPLVTIDNTSKPFLGTNPIAIAAPGLNGDMFNLDMATSQVSYSKIKKNLAEGNSIEEGWIASSQENESIEDFALLPLGGYKGMGLGMMVQILTALLADMPFDKDLSHLYSAPYDKPRKISCSVICIDPESFLSSHSFRSRVSELLALAKSQSDSVILAGDKEKECFAQRLKYGIPVSAEDEQWILQFKDEMDG